MLRARDGGCLCVDEWGRWIWGGGRDGYGTKGEGSEMDMEGRGERETNGAS